MDKQMQQPCETIPQAKNDAERILRLIQQAENLDQDEIERIPELIHEINGLTEPGDGQTEAECLLLTARYHVMKDDYIQAVALAGDALQRFTVETNAIGMIKARVTLGYAYGQLGRLDGALQYFLDALSLYGETGQTGPDAQAVRGSLLNNLATIYSDLGRYDEALDVLQEVLAQAEVTGGVPLVAVLTNLSEAHLKKGNLMNALVYNQRALVEIKTKKLGNMHLFQCHSSFGRVYEQSGQPDKAIASYRKALEAANRMNNRHSRASALVGIGTLELDNGQPDQAVTTLTAALTLAGDIQAGELLRSIHSLLVRCHEARQDYKNAFLHLKEFVGIDKALHVNEIERKLNNTTAEMKIDQARKDAEIHRLRNVELRQKSIEIEQKALELEESYHSIKAISEIGQRITNTLDVERVLSTIYESIAGLMDAGSFAIGLLDDAMGVVDYKIVVVDSSQRPLFQVSADDGRSIASAVVKTGREIMLDDADSLFTENALMQGKQSGCNPPESTICCPLTLADRITGVILVQSCRASAYTGGNLETVKALASFIAIALNNSRQSEELQTKARELELASRTDPLTGLNNRRHAMDKIEEERIRFRRNARPFSIIICDIDFFKKVNDVYGHDCGDAVLKSLADLLERHIRSQDCLARWGGEEFLMLLPETDAAGATVLAEKLRRRVQEHEFQYAGLKLPITMTFGVAQYIDEYGVDACIVGADSALYKGKSNGRNCVVTF